MIYLVTYLKRKVPLVPFMGVNTFVPASTNIIFFILKGKINNVRGLSMRMSLGL